jgi:hypothetical protein
MEPFGVRRLDAALDGFRLDLAPRPSEEKNPMRRQAAALQTKALLP